jgi:excinuclease ABC subunit C
MEQNITVTQLQRGIDVIRAHVKTLPNQPGVYRMLNTRGDVLYVGKAKSLRSRVTSYTQTEKMPLRLQRMVAETVKMEFVTTRSEVEALLLESNLIKKFLPRYNILLKDNKSFVYMFIQGTHDYPLITKHRGEQKQKGWYYGPFASVAAVNETIVSLHKVFRLRSCSDSVFASRTRPCLQYHIKRCSAPCVDYITKEDYAESVRETRAVLEGKNTQVMTSLNSHMARASAERDYEQAAVYRDRIKALSFVLLQQAVHIPGLKDADVLAVAQESGRICIQVFFYRQGSNYGSRVFFPQHDREDTVEEVLAAFMGQLYEDQTPPKLILINCELLEHDLLMEALSLKAEIKVDIKFPKRGKLADLISHAAQNAADAMKRKIAEHSSRRVVLQNLAERFGLIAPPKRIEIYDNSHISGASAIGAMVVAGPDGFIKQAYRKFNIKSTELSPGDDYGMMREVFSRRFKRSLAKDLDADTLPDLIIVDGGKGQLSVVFETLADQGVADIPLVAIAKGAARTPGEERFFMPGREEFRLDKKDPVFYYIQTLRDEAHRFAIGSHRIRRSNTFKKSLLDDISGIGPKRKQALLRYFGSAVSVSRAGVADLQEVEGINEALAQHIYDHFHG